MNKYKLILSAFFVLAVLALGLFLFQKEKPIDFSKIKEIEINKGMSFSQVSSELKLGGVISSEMIFKIYGALSGSFGDIKPGRYFIPENISVSKLMKMLVEGPEEISVVIPPGLTLAEIDDKLSALAIIKPGELINFNVDNLREDYPWLPVERKDAISGPLEGFLMPDTYNFIAGADIDSTIRIFLDNFHEKAQKAGGLLFFAKQGNVLKIINLASILEKEVPDSSERRLAAGILNKRLSVNMPLQVDAALVYGECGGRFMNCPSLSRDDYKKDFSYNVYIKQGLPPGPISNPSLDAITAALNPEKSDYWYYLSDPKTKQTIFSKTLEEHNENRARYLNM
ncbi:MAG: endolytic transglycosylase MltG [Candidatus Paceibacterota bacterium]